MCNGVANLNVPVLIYTRSPILPDPRNPCWSHTQCSYDPCMTHYAKLIGSTEPSLGRQTAVGSLLRRGGLGTVHWAGWKARKGTQWWLLEYQAKTLLSRVLSSHLVRWRPAWISYPPFCDRPITDSAVCIFTRYCRTNGSKSVSLLALWRFSSIPYRQKSKKEFRYFVFVYIIILEFTTWPHEKESSLGPTQKWRCPSA